MKRNPLIPFALIAALGIAVMLIISLKGAKQADEIANGDKKPAQTASTKPDEIYAQTCVSCHGDQLQGVVGPNLTKVGSKYSEDQIKDILKNGKEGGMPAGLLQGPQLDAVAKWLSEKK
ncbi:cytochrome c550 [Gottfriedia acidiceleris]|uniref:cytochrome c550 n=1 Tax=Gottfriedia acidiceleris TaxID=371036 RepID=UPI00101DE769|nr:cytochrome c [Gottfriedia acidiceleris]